MIRSESCIGTLVSWFDSDQPGLNIADCHGVEELKRTVNFPGRIHYPNLFTYYSRAAENSISNIMGNIQLNYSLAPHLEAI